MEQNSLLDYSILYPEVDSRCFLTRYCENTLVFTVDALTFCYYYITKRSKTTSHYHDE